LVVSPLVVSPLVVHPLVVGRVEMSLDTAVLAASVEKGKVMQERDMVLAGARERGKAEDMVLLESSEDRVEGLGLPLDRIDHMGMVRLEASLEQVAGMAEDMVLAEALDEQTEGVGLQGLPLDRVDHMDMVRLEASLEQVVGMVVDTVLAGVLGELVEDMVVGMGQQVLPLDWVEGVGLPLEQVGHMGMVRLEASLEQVVGMAEDTVLAEALGDRVEGVGLPLDQVVVMGLLLDRVDHMGMVIAEASLEQAEQASAAGKDFPGHNLKHNSMCHILGILILALVSAYR